MINGMESVQKSGRETMDKTMQSLGAVARGWQALATETADYSKQALDDGAAHFEKLLGVKSFDGAVAAQSQFMQAAYEKAVGQGQRFGELYLNLVKDAAKPFEAYLPTSTR